MTGDTRCGAKGVKGIVPIKMDRVTEDDGLKDVHGQTIIYRPIIIIEHTDDAKCQYRLHLSELDPLMKEPKLYGIMLSDLLDHIAAAYSQLSARDPRDVRNEIFKVMRDEDRFKEKDPSRGAQRGTTIMPQRQ